PVRSPVDNKLRSSTITKPRGEPLSVTADGARVSMLHVRCCTAALLFVLLCFCPPGYAQDSQAKPAANPPAQADDNRKSADDPEFQRAQELYHAGKMLDAMPLFEKLAATYPNDVVVLERWGVTVLNSSSALADPELRRKARVKARSILLKAKELGDNS